MNNSLKIAGLCTVFIALAGCGEEDKNSQIAPPADSADMSWTAQYVVALQDIEIVLPDNRLFHLDTTAFVPSVITEGMGMDEYTEAARAVIQDKAQYYVDIYACRGHGDTFYAYMPASTLEAKLPFTSHASVDDINPDVLFDIEDVQTRYQNFGQDEFTVNRAEHTGTREYSHQDAMETYIAENRGNHRPQDPTCSANFTNNIGGPAPQ